MVTHRKHWFVLISMLELAGASICLRAFADVEAAPAATQPADAADEPVEPTTQPAPDPIADKLAAAKAEFDRERGVYAAAVEAWLGGREEAARQAGDKKRIDEIKAQRLAFEQGGAAPEGLPVPTRRRYERAEAAIAEAYREAIAEFVKAHRDEDADAVEAEARAVIEAVAARESAVELRRTAPGLLARQELESSLAGSRWELGGSQFHFKADGTVRTTGPKQSAGLDLTWAAVSGNEIVVRWPSNDFDIFTVSGDGRRLTKDWLGKPAGAPQNVLHGTRVK